MRHEAGRRIELSDADVRLFPEFFSAAQSDRWLESLKKNIAWEQQHVSMFGRTVAMPRLTAWHGDKWVEYSYSGITHRPHAWTDDLMKIKARIEQVADTRFNSVLLNRYRDGRDSVSWHSDDEPALGTNPVIASVSFGQLRRFQFKHKHDSQLRESIELAHGSLLLMGGATQHYWLHQVPKSKRPMAERINLTYRVIQPGSNERQG